MYMKILITAKPRAKEEKVEKIDDAHFIVSVKEPPVRGLANAAIVKVLAQYFGVPISSVVIISGRNSRQKIVEIK